MHTFGGLLVAVVLVALAGRATAAAAGAEADDLRVLPAGAGGEALRTYLLKQCQDQFDARRKAVAEITKPEQVLERQAAMKKVWTDAIGPLPDRTPLEARVTGTLDRDGYRIEKVLYESRPGHHVTGNLYLPKAGKPPFPGVLVPCGHSKNGKGSEAYQTVSILLATHGFVVLCYDPIGQGERIQTFDAAGKPAADGTKEHTLIDIGARLAGTSVMAYRIWDGIRSLDYLAGRPEVDPKRLGCTGNSGGGTLTSYLMATDERIVAAAPSCYLTSFERLFATIGPQDGEQNPPGAVASGFDHADFLTVRAPKPTIMLAASKDFFDIDGTWATFREAKRLYSLLGHGEQVDLFEAPGPHGYAKPQREACLRWMRRWLQGIDEPAVEPTIKPNTDADLQVTQTGQVVPELKGRTCWDFNRDAAKRLADQRAAFWKTGSLTENRTAVVDLAGIRPVEAPTAKVEGTLRREGYVIEKLALERPGEPPVPALLFLPEKRDGKAAAVLYVDSRGKAAEAGPGGAVETLVKAGQVVLSIDARGFGETDPAQPKGYWGKEYPVAYLALHLGRPLIGQRVEDVLAALKYLAGRAEVDAAKLSIVGVEAAGPVALHAAALDERLGEVTLVRSIRSWTEVVETPLSRGQLQNVVPGALERYDLPDLVNAIAPRKVQMVDPRGPGEEPTKPPTSGKPPAESPKPKAASPKAKAKP